MRDQFAGFDRTSGVGASEVAAVLGLSPHRDILDVWLEKTHNLAWRPPRMTPAMEWGHRLEPLLLEKYTDDTGRPVYTGLLPGEHTITEHDGTYAYWHWDGIMYAHLDGWVRPDVLFEGKTTTDPADWADGVPVRHVLQVQSAMAIAGALACVVAVLINGRDYRTFVVEADPVWQDAIQTEVEAFWRLVQEGRPPVEIRDPLILYPQADLALPYLDGSPWAGDVARLQDLRRQIADLQQEEARISDVIKHAVGEHPGMEAPGWRLDYRNQRPSQKVGWEQVAAGLENALETVRRFREHLPPEAAALLDPKVYDALVSLYTTPGRAVRPFILREVP